MDSNDQDKILNTDSEKVLINTAKVTNSTGPEVKKAKVPPKSYYPCHLCHRKFQALRGLHYHQHFMHGLETQKKKVIIKRNLYAKQKPFASIPSLMKHLQETENDKKESVSDINPPESKRQKRDDNDNNLEQRTSRSCNICLYNASAEDCRNHMTSHQFLFPYDCKKCHWRFDSKLKLIEHTQYCQDNHGDSVKIFISKIGNNPRNSYTVSLDTPEHLKETTATRDANSPSEKTNVSFEQIIKLFAARYNDQKLLRGPKVVLKRLQKEDISKWQFAPSPQTFCAMLSQNCDGLLMKIRKTNLEKSGQLEESSVNKLTATEKDSIDTSSKNSKECGNEGDQSMIPQVSEGNENSINKTNYFLTNLLNKGNPESVCKIGDPAPTTVEKPVSNVTVNPIVVKSVTVPLPSSSNLGIAKPAIPNSASKLTGEVAANTSNLDSTDGSNSEKTVTSGDNIDEQVAVIVERIMSKSGMQCSTNTSCTKSTSASESTTQKHTESTSLSPVTKSPSNSEASNSFLPTLANLLKNSPKVNNPQSVIKQTIVPALHRSSNLKTQTKSSVQRMTVSQIINGVGNYKCPTCERFFKSKYSLETHLLIHQDLRPFPCPICSKPFRQKCTLTRHMLVHRENMIECDKCKKIFQNPAEFQTHLPHCVEGARGRILKPNTASPSSVIQTANPNMLRANSQNRNFVNNSAAARAAMQRSGTIIHPNPNRSIQNRKILNNEVIEIEDDDEIVEVNKQKMLQQQHHHQQQQQIAAARRNSAGTTSISSNNAHPVIQNVCSAGISLPSSSATPPGNGSKTMTISVTSAPLEKLPLKSSSSSNPYISQIMQNKQITLTPVQRTEQSNTSGVITNPQLTHPLPVPTPLLKNKELTIVPLSTSTANTKNDSVTIIPVVPTSSPDQRALGSAQSSNKTAGVSITPVAQKAPPNQFLHSRLTQSSTYPQTQQHHNSSPYTVAPPPPPLIPIQGNQNPQPLRVQQIPVSGSNSINQISYSSYNQRSNTGNEYTNRQGAAYPNQTGQYPRSYSGAAATTAANYQQQQLQQRLYQQRISQQHQLAQQRQLAQQQLAQQRQQLNQQRQLAQQQQLAQQMAQQSRHNPASVYSNTVPNPNANQSIRYPSVPRYPQYRNLPQQSNPASAQPRASYGYPYATQSYPNPNPNVQLQQRLQGYVSPHAAPRMPQAAAYGKYPHPTAVSPYATVSSPQVLNKNNPLSTLSQFVETNTSPSQPSTPSWHHPSTSEANPYFNQKAASNAPQNTSYYSTNPPAAAASTWFPQSGIPPATQPTISNVTACEIPGNQTNPSTNKENQARFSSQGANPVQDIEAMSCGICSQVFSDDAMLSAHLLTHTDQNGDPDVILCSEVPKVDFFSVKQEKVEEASKSSEPINNENQEDEILNTPKFRNLSNVLLLSDEEDIETNTSEPTPLTYTTDSPVQIDKDQVVLVEVVAPEVVPIISHPVPAAEVEETYQSSVAEIEVHENTEEDIVIEETDVNAAEAMESSVPEIENGAHNDTVDELENDDVHTEETEEQAKVEGYVEEVSEDMNEEMTEDDEKIVAKVIANICKAVETNSSYAFETDFPVKQRNTSSDVQNNENIHYSEAYEKLSSHGQSEIDIAEDLASVHDGEMDSQSLNVNMERHIMVEEHTEIDTNSMECEETADDGNSKHFSDNFAASPSSINALDLSIEKSCSCSSLNISGETPGTCCPDEDMSINEDPISLQLSDNEEETQYNSEINETNEGPSFNIESIHSAYDDSMIEEDQMKVRGSVLDFYSDRVSEEMQNWSSSNGEAFTVQFSCPICDQVFSTQQLFYKHLVMHQEPLNSSCNYCNKTFASPQQLKKHLKQHLWQNHLKNSVSYRKRVHDYYKFLPPRMAFRCKICCKKFFNFKLYRIHHRQCGKSWTAAKTLAIPIIDLQTVARNTNNLESLGITGFIPLMSQVQANSQSSSLMQKLGIPLVDTKNLQSEHLRNLAELEINQSLLLDGLQTVDNILENQSNIINRELDNFHDSDVESSSEIQKSENLADLDCSNETSNMESVDDMKIDEIDSVDDMKVDEACSVDDTKEDIQNKMDSLSSTELNKVEIEESVSEDGSESNGQDQKISELKSVKEELTISIVTSETSKNNDIVSDEEDEEEVNLKLTDDKVNDNNQVNGCSTENEVETGPSNETLENLKKLGLVIEVKSLASEISVTPVEKTNE